MNLNPRRREEPDVNLTPLIDVVFLLLIFFMVSTTFRKEADIEVDLPEASTEAASEQQGLEVVIDAEGGYFINGNPLTDTSLKALTDALAEIAGDDREQPFTIRADAMTPHQYVVRAMDAAGQLGFQQLSIPTQRLRGDGVAAP